jgi:hypothetical protein
VQNKSEEIEAGLSTSRPCKSEVAAHDWLEHGAADLSARGRFAGGLRFTASHGNLRNSGTGRLGELVPGG